MDLENLICHECNSMEDGNPEEDGEDADYGDPHDFDNYDAPDYGPDLPQWEE
jgi:hypothetical protein